MCGPFPLIIVNVVGPVVGTCCGKRSGPAREGAVAKWCQGYRHVWMALVPL